MKTEKLGEAVLKSSIRLGRRFGPERVAGVVSALLFGIVAILALPSALLSLTIPGLVVLALLVPFAAHGLFVTGGAGLAIAARVRHARRLLFLLIVLIPLSPLGGKSFLMLAAGVVITRLGGRRILTRTRWALPFLVVWALWGSLSAVRLLVAGVRIVAARPEWTSFVQLHTWLQSGAARDYRILQEALSVMIIVALLSFVDGRRRLVTRVLPSALTVGLALGLTAFLLQRAGIEWDGLARSDFFRGVGRFSGAFSDPNACGVFLALTLPLLWTAAANGLRRKAVSLSGIRRIGPAVLSAAWLAAAGLWAGSRSLFLGLTVQLAYRIFLWAPRRLALFGLLLGGIFLLHNVLLTTIPDYRSLDGVLPVGLGRLWVSVSIHSMSEAFFSRQLFWSLAGQVFLHHPLTGVGPEGFALLVPCYSARQGVDLRLWADNPNSFYLALASEHGLVGIAALLVSAMGLKAVRSHHSRQGSARLPLVIAARGSTLSLFLLLLLGPHFVFPEVAAVSGLLLGIVFEPRRLPPKLTGISLVVSLAALLSYVPEAFSRDFGFYRWEGGGGELWRWTAGEARGRLTCGAEGQSALKLRVGRPDVTPDRPLLIGLTVPGQEPSVKKGVAGQEVRFEFPCRPSESVPYRISVSSVWQPPGGQDGRFLGVQVLSGGVCEGVP